MKWNKLLISAPLFIAPVTMISSLCSCNDKVKFEAHTKETLIQSYDMVIDIPLTFSYSPKQELWFSLVGKDLSGISIVTDHFKVKNNKAKLQLKIADDIWTSKAFEFDLRIVYDDLKEPYLLKGFEIIYIFEHPVSKDAIRLASSKDIVFPDNVEHCEFSIQFEKPPHEHKAYTSLQNVHTSDDGYTIRTDESSNVVEDMGKYFMNFTIWHDHELPKSLNFWATFDMVISFTNTSGNQQTETIYGCTVTHLAIE